MCSSDLWWLSESTGLAILVVATLYGVGKTFFWPTMLGVVSEQFPKGGALTLNAISGVGMIAVGIVGNPLFGYWQDSSKAEYLLRDHPAIHAAVVVERSSVFGTYQAVDAEKEKALSEADKAIVAGVGQHAQKDTLGNVAVLPVIMCLAYLVLWGWFRARGGYKPVVLESASPPSS